MDGQRRGSLDALCDLMVSSMSMYPLAAGAGFAYWAELAATATSYYGDVVEGVARALCNPRDRDAVASELALRARKHMAHAGDVTERAILEFNQRLECPWYPREGERGLHVDRPANEDLIGSLRGVINAAMHETSRFGSPGARPDLDVVKQRIERLLEEEIRRAQSAGVPPPSGFASASGPTGG
jgi:hypothetical protein